MLQQRSLWNNRPEFWWGLAGTALALIIFFIVAALGWPGAASGCTLHNPDTCFCERFTRAGALIKQPANTWGNLGFITIGLITLWRVGVDRVTALIRANPMTSASIFAIAYGALVIFLGPSSMFFHASLTYWGNWVDTFGMILYGSFGLLYSLNRVFRWPGYVFPVIYVGLNASLGLYTWLVSGTGTPVFTVLVIAWIINEIIVLWFKPNGVQRQWPWFAAALAVFAVALVIWYLSQTSRPWCDPDSLLQGHAIWHLLTACVTGCMFLYLRTETTSKRSLT